MFGALNLRRLSKRQAVGVISFGIAVVTGIVTISSYLLVRKLLLTNVQQEMLADAEKQAQQIDQWLLGKKTEVESIANSPATRSMSWAAMQPYLQAELKRVKPFHRFFIASVDGRHLLTTNKGLLPILIRDRTYFQEAMHGSVSVSDPLMSRNTQKPSIIIAAPIRVSDGRIVGIFAGGIHAERFQINAPKSGNTVLLSSTGKTIRSTAPLPSDLLQHLKLRQKTGIETLQGYSVVYASLKEAPWLVVRVFPQATVELRLLPLNALVVVISSLIVVAIIGVYRQLHYSATLQQERQRLQALIHHAPVAMAIFDHAGCMIAHSECWWAEANFLGERIVGNRLRVPDHWQDVHQQAIQGKVVHRSEEAVLLEDGTNHWLKWTMQPWYQDGHIGGSFLLVQPIDQLVQTREAALETARFKSQFLANMSHEIRTPMNGVLGSAELLLGDDLQPEQCRFVEIIHSNAQHLLKVVNDILDLSKLEAGKLDLDCQWFDLDGCVREVIQVMETQASAKQITLKVQAKGSVPNRLCGDASRLKQVLFNLMGNAIKFTPSHGKVSLLVSAHVCQEETAVLRFEVNDTGIGIARRDYSKLFRAFSQVDASPTRHHEGTGLGLAISKQLVERMDGKIGFHSKLGKGSSFCFTARFDVGNADPLPSIESVAPVAPVLQPLVILLVEDNSINQYVLQHQIQRLGHQAEIATTGAAAIGKLKQKHFDLILMDCQMPGLDGYGTTRLIRHDPAYTNLPIIALTAHAMAEERQRCLDAGMNDYLSKPVSQSELAQMLRRWSNCSTVQLQNILFPSQIQQANASLNVGTFCPHASPVDVGQLLETFDGMGAVLVVMQKFVRSAERELAALDVALTQQDWQAVGRFSHRFRGACVVVRSEPLTQLTEQLELLAKQSHPLYTEGQRLLECCRREVWQINRWVQSTRTDAKKKLRVNL